MADPQFTAWNEELDNLLERAAKDCSFESPISLNILASIAYKWASPSWKIILGTKRARDDLGKKIRKRRAEDEQPMIPELLDGYAKIDGGYVHMSQLPRGEILHRRNKLQKRVRTSLLKIAAYDELLAQDLPTQGEAP